MKPQHKWGREAIDLDHEVLRILVDAAQQIEALMPNDAGSAMSLMDAVGNEYDDIFELADYDQNVMLEKRGQQTFRWIVNANMKALRNILP